MNNIFANLPPDNGEEVLEILLQHKNVTIERIVSYGNQTPDGYWYDQDTDEWVILQEGTATIQYEEGREQLIKGSNLFIPAHKKHRVEEVSHDAIWLAIHIH